MGGDERSAGSNTLNVGGTLTNTSGADISLGGVYTRRDQINASALANNGTVTILPSAQVNLGGVLSNGGSIVISAAPVNIPQAGLNVGLGPRSVGYNQFPNGTLDELIGSLSSYGTITDNGPAALSGTLDILLGNGFVPTPGESFTILTFTPGELTGTWGSIVGDPYFAITYDNLDGYVRLTAEPVPEPATTLLCVLGLVAVVGCQRLGALVRNREAH